VNLAAGVLAGFDVPLGVVPAGTGNDFAGALGLTALDVVAAADVIAAGATRSVDLARVTRGDGTSALYATVLATGFDSKVNDRANRMRWPAGESRYTLAILIELLRLARIPYEIEWEGADGT
jgi:diacylglycerol kinase (ATP)